MQIKPLRALARFIHLESAGGLCLMASAVLAMIVANSPLADEYQAILAIPITVSIGDFSIAKPLVLWINDGLMTVFFFLVGLELKREILEGHLSSLKQAALPAFAAVGGMVFPALFYYFFNHGNEDAIRGWAIPAATDIAFALGVLSLLGGRVPSALKAFLLSVAIFDDIGAIAIIAVFYTAELSTLSLLFAGIVLLGFLVLNRFSVGQVTPYILLGIPLWIAVLKSGVHATLAGVVSALFIPMKSSERQESPLLGRLEHGIHPWVAFGVLPIFAFVNAGVPVLELSLSDILHPVSSGVISGLFLGKQIGVFLFSWLAVLVGVAALPYGIKWRHIHGVALLSGIGFTMSLFVATLAFDQKGISFDGLDKLGILVGSLLAGVLGYIVLSFTLEKGNPKEVEHSVSED